MLFGRQSRRDASRTDFHVRIRSAVKVGVLSTILIGCGQLAVVDAGSDVSDAPAIDAASERKPILLDAGVCGLCSPGQACGHRVADGCDAKAECV
jgi:hypothetical protein